jgi:CRP/FNR family transcriptional regulator, cyclic AMP receptor protein
MYTEPSEPASDRYSNGFAASVKSGKNGSDGLTTRDSKTTYQAGAVLYREGQRCAGIFRIESGEVKLSVSSSSGRTAILKIAHAGELLGVTEAFTDSSYLTSAETMEQSQVSFIPRSHLEGLLSHAELTAQILVQLSSECLHMLKQVSAHRLSFTASQRLAYLLLELLGHEAHEANVTQMPLVKVPYTHAEIGQLIGCSRETVTRLLKSFQQGGLIDVNRSTIRIRQLEKLQEIARM